MRLANLRGTLAVVIVAGSSVAAASAASPKPSTVYRGSGRDVVNTSGRWSPAPTGNVRFKTQSDGSAILNFRGTYFHNCGAHFAAVTDAYIPVSKAGKFADHFSAALRTPSGQTYGRAFATISGVFINGGKAAKVSYMVDFVYPGQTVRHPYLTSHPGALGCATWVRATIPAAG